MHYSPKLVLPFALAATILLTWVFGLHGREVLLVCVGAYFAVDVLLAGAYRFTGWAIRTLGGDAEG